jgi:hypothetical protein
MASQMNEPKPWASRFDGGTGLAGVEVGEEVEADGTGGTRGADMPGTMVEFKGSVTAAFEDNPVLLCSVVVAKPAFLTIFPSVLTIVACNAR